MSDEQHTGWLARHQANVYSQNGEDGILATIFHKIGTASRYCFECGAGDGLLFSNTRLLVEERGFTALLIEADPDRFARLQANAAPTDVVMHRRVTDSGPDAFDAILTEAGAPDEIDLGVIDIDGQDWYAWNAMSRHHPRVMVVEFDPDAAEEYLPKRNGPGQAGRGAILLVGLAKHYQPVAQTRTNLIFVRADLMDPLWGPAR